MLPEPSIEQCDIVKKLDKNNVIVDAVAGSGKTTTSIHIAKFYKNRNILLLTYNAKLKLETREKADYYKLTNLEVHTYHAFCVKYYDNHCFTDTILLKLLNSQTKKYTQPLKPFKYDMIIIDEAQDMSIVYYELVCKILKDNILKNNTKLCILGDKNQSIFEFNNADPRFITLANEIFNINSFEWSSATLSISYRITNEMALFINNSVLKYNRMKAIKSNNIKPKYVICDAFENKYIFNCIKQFLEIGYLPTDIFILAPSVKNINAPVRKLENQIKQKMPHIQVYVPTSDDEKLDSQVLDNKLIFSTFHQAKGLERKIVIVYGFDDSYFKFYAKNKNPLECPNTIYVAITRAKEQLILIHHYANDYLQFIDKDILHNYVDVIFDKYLDIESNKDNRKYDTNVTDLVKHLPVNTIQTALTYIKINIINKKEDTDEHISIPTKIKQIQGYENVSEITGTAIPAYYEYKFTNKLTILKTLQDRYVDYNNDNEKETDDENEYIIDMDDDADDINNFITNTKINTKQIANYDKIKILVNNISFETLTPDELLLLTTHYCSRMSGYIFKTMQITEYNWITKDNLNKCISRLETLKLSTNSKFEVEKQLENRTELVNRKLIGRFDCIDEDNNILYELKCVNELNSEHYLQTALYAYLDWLDKEKTYNNNKKVKLELLKTGDIVIYNKNQFGIITRKYKTGKIHIKNSITNIIDKININCINSKKDDIFINITKYYLYNVLSNELIEIKVNILNLIELVRFLINEKYFKNNNITDEEFILNASNILKKYL